MRQKRRIWQHTCENSAQKWTIFSCTWRHENNQSYIKHLYCIYVNLRFCIVLERTDSYNVDMKGKSSKNQEKSQIAFLAHFETLQRPLFEENASIRFSRSQRFGLIYTGSVDKYMIQKARQQKLGKLLNLAFFSYNRKKLAFLRNKFVKNIRSYIFQNPPENVDF